jgi:hypothetical protein
LRQALARDPSLLDGWLLLMNLALQQQRPDEACHALIRLSEAMNNRSFTDFANDQLAWMR